MMAPVPTATESFLGPDLTLDAVVTSEGNLRVAGHLKGNVDVDGELTIESGALVEGEMKAAAITVAPGARMRGTMQFGWPARRLHSR
jgi:cytoskeletal protein CcmA (bactofilin family)